MKSIRGKLTLLIIGIIVFVLLSFGILNTLYFEKYYIEYKKSDLRKAFNNLSSIYTENKDELSLNLESYETSKGLRFVIVDENLKTIYSTKEYIQGSKSIGTKGKMLKVNMSFFQDPPYIEQRHDAKVDGEFLVLYGLMHINNTPVYVIIETPISAIKDSIYVTNSFFLKIALIVIAISLIITTIVTKSFTKPINEINRKTKEMEMLNFSDKISIKNKDELGELSNSINSMSNQLEIAIRGLMEANEKLKEDLKEKEKIDDMRKEFISNVSHELKTPISLIMGYAEGLKVNINEGQREFYYEVIIDEAKRMNSLVKKLLYTSNIQCKTSQLSKEHFYLEELIKWIVDKNSLIINEKNIELELVFQHIDHIFADKDKIEQAITNYLTNAIDYTDIGGKVRIEVKKHDDKVRVSVFNTGKNIEEKHIEKIWESFYKVDEARTRSYGGSGLGLYIVKTIIEAHEGKVGVENKNNGVEFWFQLK